RIWFTISRRRADMPTCSGLPTFSTRSSARIEAARIVTARAAVSSRRQEREGYRFIGSTPRKVRRVRAFASLRLQGRAPLLECLGPANQGIIRLPGNGQRFNGRAAAVRLVLRGEHRGVQGEHVGLVGGPEQPFGGIVRVRDPGLIEDEVGVRGVLEKDAETVAVPCAVVRRTCHRGTPSRANPAL